MDFETEFRAQVAKFDGLPSSVRDEFEDAASSLAEESIQWDGEASKSQARANRKKAVARWNKLCKRYGVDVHHEWHEAAYRGI